MKLTPFSGDGNYIMALKYGRYDIGLKLTPFSGDGNKIKKAVIKSLPILLYFYL